MSDDQAQAAWDRIVARYGPRTCPICQSQHWRRAQLVSRLDGPLPRIAIQWLRRAVTVRASPAIAVVCAICGYTRQFDFHAAVTRQA